MGKVHGVQGTERRGMPSGWCSLPFPKNDCEHYYHPVTFTGDYNASCNETPGCSDCGSWREVTFAPDPYNEDVRNDPTPVWMCKRCRDESAQDI